MGHPEIRPFRAVRYDEAVAGELGRLIAPPYDVVPPDLVARLDRHSPYNVVHLEHVRPDPGDDPHALAAGRYRDWLRQGVLRRDERPALYRYDHTFTAGGERRTRRGVFAAVRLAPWEARIVLPHEQTFPGPVAERHRRLWAVQANLSPIYLLAASPAGALGPLLETAGDRPVTGTVDPDGERHLLAAVHDPAQVGAIAEAIAACRLYVADGHHRYEAALAYSDGRRAGREAADAGADPADEVLALIVDAADPGVAVLPTQRLVRGLPAFDPGRVRHALAAFFALDPIESGDEADLAAALHEPDIICLARFAGEGRWWRLQEKPGLPLATVMPADRSDAWRRLDTAVLHAIVLERVLGLDATGVAEHVGYTHDAATAGRAVADGEAQIALLVKSATVAEIVAVADAGDRMPPKSTYFSPKVPAGLVIRDLT